jgi:hypothetical protein
VWVAFEATAVRGGDVMRAHDPSLRRRTDRVEDAAAWLLTAAGLVLVVVAGMLGAATYAERAEQIRHQAARIPATAVLLEPAPLLTGHYTGVRPVVPVAAQWSAPDGSPRSGSVPAISGSTAGVEVLIWIDRDGHSVAPPSTPLDAVTAGLGSAVALLVLGEAALVAGWAALRRVIMARNLRRWEREWTRIGPDWGRSVR